MQTQKKYLEDRNAFSGDAKLISTGRDDRGAYVLLDKTWFYPQGGGQPSDKGVLKWTNGNVDVTTVRAVNDEVRHYVSGQMDIAEGQDINLKVDSSLRFLHSKCHSAGHLIHHIVEELFPKLKAVKGHHFLGEAYVEFKGMISEPEEAMLKIQEVLEQKLAQYLVVKSHLISTAELKEISQNLPYELPNQKEMYVCQIGAYIPNPCGGTHVNNVKDLGEIKIVRVKSKKGRTKVSYDM